MRISSFTLGLLGYLAFQTITGLAIGLDGMSVFWLGVLALVVAQAMYLVLVIVMAQAERRRRIEKQEQDRHKSTTDSGLVDHQH